MKIKELNKDIDSLDMTPLRKKLIKSMVSLAFSEGRKYQLERMEKMYQEIYKV